MRFTRRKSIVVAGLTILVLCLILAPMAIEHPASERSLLTESVKDNTAPQMVDETIIEGQPVFVTSSAGDDYVDAVENEIYGSQTNAPPLGMAVDSTTSTDITEESFSSSSYTNLMTQATFSEPLPAGWTDDGFSYSSGDFRYNQIDTSGYLECSSVSTTSYEWVSFTVYATLDWIGMQSGSVHVYFYDSTASWDDMGAIPETGYEGQDHTFSSSSTQYQHSEFKVRITYNGFSELSVFFSGNNWRIDARDDVSGNQLRIIYEFTGVDYSTFVDERLYVDFDSSSSSEYLDFYFESGDATPDVLVANHVNSDFSVNIHSWLTGSTCYVGIVDEYQAGDGDIDTWRIDRLYIKLTNALPTNDQPALCTNLDDGDNLYANYKLYEFHASTYDADGYAHIDYVELSSYESPGTNLRWRVRFDEDTNSFTEEAGSSFIRLTGSSYVKSGGNLDVYFRLYIEWAHPDTIDDCLGQYVRDGEGASDGNFYLVNYDYETRLDISGNSIDDGIGTGFRGDVSSTATASGTVTYLGSSKSPASDEVDVWASASLHSGAGPWSDTTLDNGEFSITFDTDDEVGHDTIYYHVVQEGAGSSGTDHLASAESNAYISDRVEVQYIASNDNRVDVGQLTPMFARLYYEYDSAHVTDGTVHVNGLTCQYGSGGLWTFNDTRSSVEQVTYDSVTVSGNMYGISEVNMNGQTHNQIWDRIIVMNITCPIPSNHTNVGDTLGMYMWLVYEYDGTFLTTGSVTMEGISASYISDSIWCFEDSEGSPASNTYNTVAASGNSYGITVVNQNSMELTVVWDSVTIQITDPTDQRINLGENATGIFVSGTYDFSGDPFDGVFVLNSSTFSYASVGMRGYTVSLITGDTYGISAISTNDETYCIWDAIEIYGLSAPEWVMVDEEFNISCQARLIYDGHVLSDLDDISIDGEGAAWNGSHFFVTRVYAVSEDLAFEVSSAVENTHGISYLGISPEINVHVVSPLDIADITCEFEVNDSLYVGVYAGPPLWIHWDPLNDPGAPNITFTIEGSHISYWNVTSSWSGLEISSGTESGTFVFAIEAGLPYSQSNYTYSIMVENGAGQVYAAGLFVLVHDYVAPTISSPPDIVINEGSAGVSILWSGDDLHPESFRVTRNGLEIAAGQWNSTSESILISLDGLPAGEYTFIATLYDTSGGFASDTVEVTVEAVTTTGTTTTTTTSTTSTTTGTTTTTQTDPGTILTITIIITVSGTVVVVIIIYLKKKTG